MPLKIYRLRRWLAVMAVLFTAVVAGMYFYARLRQHSVLKGFPGKIGFDIKQTASGFQFSKSESGRTVFTIRAKNVKEFKLNGHAELHDVTIILYGRDTSRFDQIYGEDFTFDQKSGDVTAKGEVQIDLQANPGGINAPDQSSPAEITDPIHLKTSDLVFNRNSGDASTDARVDFRTPQATGWAVGVRYAAKTATLTLASQIHVTLSGQEGSTLFADHGTITREPREIKLDHPLMKRDGGTLQAEQATFFLGPENEVQRILASGNVNAESAEESGTKTERKEISDKDDKTQGRMLARADQAELLLTGKQNQLRIATLTGKVHVERTGFQPMQGNAGKAILDFAGQNELRKVHASDGVRLARRGEGKTSAKLADGSAPQDLDIAAPIIDFFVIGGRRLDRAQTSGAARITISPSQNESSPSLERTVITAGRFDAKFDATSTGKSRLASLHGEPNAKIVSVAPGVPDRVSTSQLLNATFLPEGGIATIIQQGSIFYTDGQPPDKRTQAWADKALYTPADHILLLTGSPRVTDGGMTTTANTIRMNRSSDEALADGDVKSTYNDLKEQPNGALLATSSPIHVTATKMTAQNSPATALYQGNARLWQDANVIEAPSIQFDRDHRSLVALGTPAKPVSTVLVQATKGKPEFNGSKTKQTRNTESAKGEYKANIKKSAKKPESGPITVTSLRLTYTDNQRDAHYEGDVVANGTGFRATANEMNVYFSYNTQTQEKQLLNSTGKVERMVAQGDVVIQEPGRRANGQTLVYTTSDDKFVLTGGPPSIFDAERGKITGDSLTFFRADDRVLVVGEARTPVVTQTRVTR
jgi:lipopolysaccharide export system protein LptA